MDIQLELYAALHEDIDSVERAIANGADPNSQSISGSRIPGRFPINYAASLRRPDLVRVLLQHGADLRCCSIDDHPFFIAAHHGDVETMKVLLDFGNICDVNLCDDIGRTALAVASEHGFLPMIDMLLNAGADVDKANEIGFTPLHWAVGAGQAAVVKKLLDSGASTQFQSLGGRTALDMARQRIDLAGGRETLAAFGIVM